MSLEFIYQKEVNLDNENNFIVNISEKNKVEKEKFTDGDKYLLLSLDLKIKADGRNNKIERLQQDKSLIGPDQQNQKKLKH